MLYKKLLFIFFAFNFQIIEPKVSFIKKYKNFLSNPENKKMILNVATGAICATGVSLIVSYRHELVQWLWGNGNYYVDPFINPIFIGDYACKGLEKKYKNISIKQIRVTQQSGAQCGVYALASAASWVSAKDGKGFVEQMVNADGVRSWVQQCIKSNDLIQKEKGQWLLEEELWQGISNLPKNEKSNEGVMVIADKKYISDTVTDNFYVFEGDSRIEYKNIIPDLKRHLRSEDKSNVGYYSIIMGTMEHSDIKPKEHIRKVNHPHGHWYAVNIGIKEGDLEIVVTDSLNSDRTNDEAVHMIIDTLLNDSLI